MKIEQGLFDRMVLQRVANKSDALFSGTSSASGVVRATVLRGGKPLAGWKGVAVGKATRGTLSGRIRGLPTGGAYDIRLEIIDGSGKPVESSVVRDVLVGDVWVLGGQSNMEGIGYLKDRAKPVAAVRAFFMNDRWGVALDPIHNLGEAVDDVHAILAGGQRPQRAKHVGVGPGVAFGQEMHRRTGVPQGLLACAHGGTSMQQWDPARKGEGSKSLYGAMLRRFRKNGGRIAGIVWYQGCSDASAPEAVHYTERMKTLVRSMRRDFGDKSLPIAVVQISRVCGMGWVPTHWNSIQDQQRMLQLRIPRCATVPAIDLELDDTIHISGKDQNRLGRRLGQAMAVLKGIAGAGKLPIELESIEARRDPISAGQNLVVKYRNVTGRLQAPGRPSGFEVVVSRQPANAIYHTELQGDTVLLKTNLAESDVRSAQLAYGYATMPYCNITDSADRSLPVFGPASCCDRGLAVTPFVQKMRVTAALPAVADIRKIALPPDPSVLGLKTRDFGAQFCDLHLDAFACAPEDRLAFFACRIRCEEKMRLAVGLGYDGPVKVWLNGKAKFCDPKGVNPSTPDKATIPFEAPAGEHEVVVALGANFGRAWGIHLRFIRRDVTVKQFRAGLDSVRMPAILG